MGIPGDILVGEDSTAAAVLEQLLHILHTLPEAEVGVKEYLMITSRPLLYPLYFLIIRNSLIQTNNMVWILCIIHHHDMEVLLDHSTHTNLISNIYRHYPHIILISNKYRLPYHLIF